MKNKLTLTALAALAGFAASANAQLLFDLADTTNTSLSHTTASPLAPQPGSVNVGTGTFSWGTLATDTSANTAVFSSGAFTSSDWGGVGTFTSAAINVSSLSSVTISAQFDGLFNTNTEFANFFYQLDGGSVIDFGVSLEDATYTNEVATLANLNVTGSNSLVVGFTYNHNGASDFFNVDSLTVVPEPGTFALLAGMLGMVYVMLKRRQA